MKSNRYHLFRIISFFSIVLCLSCFLVIAVLLSSAGGMSLIGSQITGAEVEKTYSVSVSYSGVTIQPIQGVTVTASWNTDSLELISVEKGASVLNPSMFFFFTNGLEDSNRDGINRATFSCAEGTILNPGSGELIVYTFKVKAGAADSSQISLSLDSFGYLGTGNESHDYASAFSVTNGSITLKNKTPDTIIPSTDFPEPIELPLSLFDYASFENGLFIWKKLFINGAPLPSPCLFLDSDTTDFDAFLSMLSFPGSMSVRFVFTEPNGDEADPENLVKTGSQIDVYDSDSFESAYIIVRGDVDASGTTDVFDAVALLSWIVDKDRCPLSILQLAAADADCSAFVDVFDAVEILTRIVGHGWSDSDAFLGDLTLSTYNGFEYVSGTTAFDGSLYVYYTNSSSVPSLRTYMSCYQAAKVKKTISVTSENIHDSLFSVDSINQYSYLAVMLRTNSGKGLMPVLIKRNIVVPGFSIAPSVCSTESFDRMTGTPDTSGTLYYFYTTSSASVSSAEFASLFNGTVSSQRGMLAVSEGVSIDTALKKSNSINSFPYVVLTIWSDVNKRYSKPIIVIRDGGFITFPKVKSTSYIELMTASAVTGTLYYYYTTSSSEVSSALFPANFNDTAPSYRGSFGVSKGDIINYNLQSVSVVDQFQYIVLSIWDNTKMKFTAPIVIAISSGEEEIPIYIDILD